MKGNVIMDKHILFERAEEYIRHEGDPFFKKEVQELLDSLEKDPGNTDLLNNLNDRFYTDLEFGTGGLRGVIGGGYNRINPYIIKRATQGLAGYVKKQAVSGDLSFVIAYDSRNFSSLFALEAALVLAGNGITVYLFSSLRPTPELSFAVRYLHTDGGIVVTASHNPKEYNGYKVFWNNGAQVLPPHDRGIINEVQNVQKNITSMSKQEALEKGLLKMIDKEVDAAFYTMVKKLLHRPDLIKERGREMKVVYTPLFGTGTIPVSTLLSDLGIEVILVTEQQKPDGDFPGLIFLIQKKLLP
jgi:phosphoglucomutase